MNYKKELALYILTSKNAKKARDFDIENPSFYNLFKNKVNEAKKSGVKKYGVKGVFELLRWHYQVERRRDNFKVNNTYAPYFARKVMSEYPWLEEFFDIRETKITDKASQVRFITRKIKGKK